jgi:hypothetical protein
MADLSALLAVLEHDPDEGIGISNSYTLGQSEIYNPYTQSYYWPIACRNDPLTGRAAMSMTDDKIKRFEDDRARAPR